MKTQSKAPRYVALALFATVLAIAPAQLILLPPNGIVINRATCETEGWPSRLQEKLYGESFWTRQLAAVHKARVIDESWDEHIAHIRGKAERINEETAAKVDAKLEEIYQKYPAAAPTSAQTMAARLRDKADELEEEDTYRMVSEQKAASVRALRGCEEAIARRLTQPAPIK